MNAQTQWILLSVILVLARAFDTFTTWLYIPDLRKESNLMVSWFGSGWIIVLILQGYLTPGGDLPSVLLLFPVPASDT